jgi:hypothetical protein
VHYSPDSNIAMQLKIALLVQLFHPVLQLFTRKPLKYNKFFLPVPHYSITRVAARVAMRCGVSVHANYYSQVLSGEIT